MIIDVVMFYHKGQGGLEKVLDIVNNEMIKRGHTIRFFVAREPEFIEWKNSIKHMYLYGNENDYINYNFEKLASGYSKKIEEMGIPDVIIATGSISSVIISELAKKYLGIKETALISWTHVSLTKLKNIQVLKYCDAHLALCDSIKKEIDEVIGNDKNVYVLKNPVFDNSVKKVKIIKKNILDLVYIGRLDNNQKRVDIILKALSLFNHDNWKLRIIGDGSDKKYYKELVTMLEIEKNIEWIEWCSNPWKIVDKATALILASDYEGTPMVLVEALSRGLPVISSNYKGVKDIVRENENGLIFECGNYEELYSLLNDIYLNNIKLPTSTNCIESVIEHRVDIAMDNFENILMHILNY